MRIYKTTPKAPTVSDRHIQRAYVLGEPDARYQRKRIEAFKPRRSRSKRPVKQKVAA